MSQVLSARAWIALAIVISYWLGRQHNWFLNRTNATNTKCHYCQKAYWDAENITGPTILKPTFVTALFSSSWVWVWCWYHFLHTPRRCTIATPSNNGDFAGSCNAPCVFFHCVRVCDACWGSVMCSGRVQLAMKSSVGRRIQNVWSSMLEMSWRRCGGSGHMFLSMAKISKHTCTLQSTGPLQSQ